MGLSEDELKPIVDAWRAANPNVVQLWADIEYSPITTRRTARLRNLRFIYHTGMLFMELPSGRRFAYVKLGLRENGFGG